MKLFWKYLILKLVREHNFLSGIYFHVHNYRTSRSRGVACTEQKHYIHILNLLFYLLVLQASISACFIFEKAARPSLFSASESDSGPLSVMSLVGLLLLLLLLLLLPAAEALAVLLSCSCSFGFPFPFFASSSHHAMNSASLSR